jgi:hypothetical protein
LKSFEPTSRRDCSGHDQYGPWAWVRNHLETAGADRLREMLSAFTSMPMNAEVDALCGAEHGERTPERTNLAQRAPGAQGALRDLHHFPLRNSTTPAQAAVLTSRHGNQVDDSHECDWISQTAQ